MRWQDEAFVLSTRPFGETSSLVHLLTREHGRHAGLARGARRRSASGLYQPGNRVLAQWSGRLAEHLGTLTCELSEAHAARLFDHRERLLALSSAAALSEAALPEREPHPNCFEGFRALMAALEGEFWAEAYVRWELLLLQELGFGLDLSACTVTGEADGLAYVSPRSGRGVSLSAGEPYKEKLLALPGFLVGRGEGGAMEVAEGLRLTGHFLERHIAFPQNRPLPRARVELAAHFSQ